MVLLARQDKTLRNETENRHVRVSIVNVINICTLLCYLLIPGIWYQLLSIYLYMFNNNVLYLSLLHSKCIYTYLICSFYFMMQQFWFLPSRCIRFSIVVIIATFSFIVDFFPDFIQHRLYFTIRSS